MILYDINIVVYDYFYKYCVVIQVYSDGYSIQILHEFCKCIIFMFLEMYRTEKDRKIGFSIIFDEILCVLRFFEIF